MLRKLSDSNSSLSRIYRNIGYLSFESISKLIFGFFISVIVARHLGAEGYGNFNYVLSFVIAFVPLYHLGIDDFVIKRLIQNPGDEDEILGTSFILRVLGGAIGTVLTISTCLLLSTSINLTNSLIIGYAFFQLLKAFDTINVYFLSTLDSKLVVYGRFASLAIGSILKLAFVFWQLDWHFFVYLSFFDLFAIAIFYSFTYQKRGKVSIFKWKFNQSYSKSLLKSGFPIFILAFFTMLIQRVDQIMIGNLSSKVALGHYAVATKLVELSYFIPLSIAMSFYPYLVEEFNKNRESLSIESRKLYKPIFLLSLSLIVLCFLSSDVFINIIYGENYKESIPLLKLYSLTTIFTFSHICRDKVFLVINKIKLSLVYFSLAFVLNVTLNAALIPTFQAKGAIWASLSSYGISTITCIILFREYRVFLRSYLLCLLPLKK